MEQIANNDIELYQQYVNYLIKKFKDSEGDEPTDNIDDWELLPKGNSNQPVLTNENGDIKRYAQLISELRNEQFEGDKLEDARFLAIERLYAENPNYLYFYNNRDRWVTQEGTDFANQNEFGLLGTYTELDGRNVRHIGINNFNDIQNRKYILLFTSNAPTFETMPNVGNIFFGSGELYCIKNIPYEISRLFQNVNPLENSEQRGGKRFTHRVKKSSRKVKRKSSRRVKRRNTKRRYRK